MAGSDTELEDPIKAAAQEDDTGAEEEETPPGEITPDVGMEALRIQLDNERKARIDAEQRAHTATNFARQSNAEVQDSNLQLVNTAIDTVTRDNLMNRKLLAEAMAAQDYDKVAEIQDVMSMNNAKLLQLRNGKDALEERAKQAREQPPAPPQGQQHDDPVEAVASQLSPRSASWIRAHPEAVKNAKTYTKMIGLHNVAVADGLKPDTDEYFDYIETNLGYKKPPRQQDVDQDEDPQAAAAKPVARRAAPPAAPPSRGSGNNRVTLSAAQREAAAISGLTEEEYGRNLVNEKRRRQN